SARSPAWRPAATPTSRSPPACRSPAARWRPTSTASTPSSASPAAATCRRSSPSLPSRGAGEDPVELVVGGGQGAGRREGAAEDGLAEGGDQQGEDQRGPVGVHARAQAGPAQRLGQDGPQRVGDVLCLGTSQ